MFVVIANGGPGPEANSTWADESVIINPGQTKEFTAKGRLHLYF